MTFVRGRFDSLSQNHCDRSGLTRETVRQRAHPPCAPGAISPTGTEPRTDDPRLPPDDSG